MLLTSLSESINSKRTLTIKDWFEDEHSKPLKSTNTMFLVTESYTKDQYFSKETPLQRGEINTKYLLAGAGAVIFMLLIIIVIQTSRKSKSAKRKSLLQRKCNENQTGDERKKYFNLTSSKQPNHDYQHMDSVYHEIDESVELMPIPVSTGTTTELGDNNLPKCNKNPINVTENDDLNAKTSRSYVSPSTCPDTHKADYLQPVFVQANIEIESKQDTHSYIDVTG